MKSGYSVYSAAFIEGLQPDPDLTLDQWADEYRVLSSVSSAEAGRWRTDRTPYLREIMRELSPSSPTQRIVFMKSSQVGGSECGFNWLGYIIHLTPAPAMMVQPTEDLAKKISKQRIEPMIDETPVLRERVAQARERDSGNTILVKEFRGGMLALVGANSAVGLRSMPIKYLFCTEVSSYPSDVGGEGDPVNLAEKRTQTFPRRKVYLESTPTLKDTCRIEAEYLKSDQRRFFVPCPHCHEMQWLKWKQVKWSPDRPETAAYCCEVCGVLIDEYHKTEMLRSGEWRATAESDGKTVGFHISSLYSPVGWKSWEEIVREFLTASKDAALLKTWVNTVLGETWEEEYSNKIGSSELKTRAEVYDAGTAPAGVLVVTAGVDVQDNRLEITRVGWGREEESWVLSHDVIFGNPGRQEIWRQLDEHLAIPIMHEHGHTLKVRMAAIDSGGSFTHEVYQYTRERQSRGYIAIKGQSQRNKPAIGSGTRVDINFKGQLMKGGGVVYPVGSDTVKSIIYNRLKSNEPGPGFIHFHHTLPDEYYSQLTAEKQITKYVKGYPVKEWTKKSGARNEALDCFVYAYAALRFIASQYTAATFWSQLEKLAANKPPSTQNNEAPRQNNPIQRMISKPGKSFVNSW